eukprot:GHVT01102339.1.p1 GENE.GHVT01102339.1~~GHVT01102339.1.p1  ORF type:complete len:198 (-),score=47.15 GHVT01102339.1:278-871(-)
MMEQEVKKGWTPDLIVFSPLNRAKATGLAFARAHPDIPTVTVDATAEMKFGSWDNQQVRTLPPGAMAHLFYLEQNAVVAAAAAHEVLAGVVPPVDGVAASGLGPGLVLKPECFVDVLLRMNAALLAINDHEAIKHITERNPRVLFYGHSMAGAAASILLGHGLCDQQGLLGFDGRYIMKHAAPAFLSKKNPKTSGAQ